MKSNGLFKLLQAPIPTLILKNFMYEYHRVPFQLILYSHGVLWINRIYRLQELKSCAVPIVTRCNYDAPSRPLMQGSGWETVDDFTKQEVKAATFISADNSAP